MFVFLGWPRVESKFVSETKIIVLRKWNLDVHWHVDMVFKREVLVSVPGRVSGRVGWDFIISKLVQHHRCSTFSIFSSCVHSIKE